MEQSDELSSIGIDIQKLVEQVETQSRTETKLVLLALSTRIQELIQKRRGRQRLWPLLPQRTRTSGSKLRGMDDDVRHKDKVRATAVATQQEPTRLSTDTKTTTKFHLVVMRGIPGSGKTMLAEAWVQKNRDTAAKNGYNVMAQIVSAEHPIVTEEMHTRCYNRTKAAMDQRVHIVVVDSCHIHLSELDPYRSLAQHYGYTFYVYEANTQWAFDSLGCKKRCIHDDVTLDEITRMLEKYEFMKE